MSSVSFIADGYVQPGYIRAVDRLHEALRFRFRPILSAQRSALVQTAQGATATHFDQQARELLADNLLDWTLSDPAGNPVAISREAIDRLQPELFLKLYRIVFGYDPSEIDPQWPKEQQCSLADDAQAAESAGRTIGELREERDEKN
jgi:hypothetical protein